MDDRAQLMLIGAVVIAVSMLALVTVLNSTIYAQNVAPGNTLDETRETDEQLRVVQTDVSRIGERLQEKHGYLGESRLNESLQAYAGQLTEQTAWRSPAHVDVGLNRTTPATVLRQEDGARIDSKNESKHWLLARNANLTGTALVTVDLQDSGQPSPKFQFVGSDNETWIVEFAWEPPDEVRTIVTYRNGSAKTITDTVDEITVDIKAGTVNGDGAFDFAPGVDGPYDIGVENGHHMSGNYSIVVDDESDVVGENFHDSPGDGKNPYTTTAVDTVVVDVSYGTGSVTMDTQVEVSPQ